MPKDRTRPGGPGGDEGGSPGPLPDLVRRMMALGLTGFFTTEEALRRALGDTIPQDWIDFAAGQSEKTRRDFSDAVAREVGRVLEGVDLAELFGRIFESRTVEIRARVRLLPEEPGQKGPRTHFERMTVDIEDLDET
jgi:hypothetical protein